MHKRNIPNYKYKQRKSSPGPTWSNEKKGAELKKFITEDTESSMQISTKTQMPDELKSYDNLAYTFPPYMIVGVIIGIMFLFLLYIY